MNIRIVSARRCDAGKRRARHFVAAFSVWYYLLKVVVFYRYRVLIRQASLDSVFPTVMYIPLKVYWRIFLTLICVKLHSVTEGALVLGYSIPYSKLEIHNPFALENFDIRATLYFKHLAIRVVKGYETLGESPRTCVRSPYLSGDDSDTYTLRAHRSSPRRLSVRGALSLPREGQ